MKEWYRDHNFRWDTRQILEDADRVATEYMEKGYTVTVRQLYYQMIAQDLFPDSWIDERYNAKNGLPWDTKNTVKNYQKFVKVVSDGRLAGYLDWDAIEDRLRRTERNRHWSSHDEILQAAVDSWAIDKWAYQKIRVEVMCEKDAVAGILEPVCSLNDVPFTACRGYGSQSLFYRKGKEIQEILLGGQHVVLLYFGDHDPSGLDMDRDIQSRLTDFTDLGDDFEKYVHFHRIALTSGQIEKLMPPPNPAKSTDSRYKLYQEQFGNESWELDAIPPEYLEHILNGALESLRDEEQWKRAIDEEASQKQELIKRIGL